ncbi:MAG: ECF-type sigma factor, partial [Planctomycetota bacterium]
SGESVPADVEERAAISATMRRLLILRARSSRTLKRGSQWRRSDADPDTLSASPRAALGEELLLIRDDLESMQSATPRVAQVARLHLFGELSLAEIARRLGVSERTAQLDWRYARAALANRLGPDR